VQSRCRDLADKPTLSSNQKHNDEELPCLGQSSFARCHATRTLQALNLRNEDVGMSKHLFHILLTLLLSFIGTIANATSFDCKLAQSKVETMICADSGVSKLDEQLSAVYAQFRKTSSDETVEKVMQLAWLKTRNTCEDQACLRRAFEARIAELRARSASASPIVGIWKKEYSCVEATGIFEERCKKGERDVFELAIQVNGAHVCIIHMATAGLGNRVDEVEDLQPSMTGKVNGNVATVRFRSAWGGTGTAMLRVEGNSLHWKVNAKNKGESWIPDEAVLPRIPAGPYDRMPECGS
jgi:uncharacterized protein